MRRLNNSGFTIIETTLVLAISGALIGALLIGTWTSINAQRYRDSATSLESIMKQQYSDVMNVGNNSTASLPPSSCGLAAPTTVLGQSDCIILGRFLVIDDNTITTRSIAGYKDPSLSGSGVAELTTVYKLYPISGATEISQLEWGARVAWPSSGTGSKSPTTPRSISFLMLRSPSSGLVYTFSSDGDNTDPNSDALKAMIVAADAIPGQSARKICINSNGGFNGGLSIWVDSSAYDASSVKIHTNDIVYDGDAAKC